MSLDFSELSDDQIVELGAALAQEALRRSPATAAAFAQALLDEKERVEAAIRGAAEAKKQEAAAIREQSRRAEAQLARERQRQRVQAALAAYLSSCAAIIGRQAADITLVWLCDGLHPAGPRLQVNLGATGERAPWHLINYLPGRQQLNTSPGLRNRHADILPWCREAVAAITALGVQKTTVIRGIEL